MKQIMENFNRFVAEDEVQIIEEQEVLNENRLAMLAGAGVLILLRSKPGRALISRILRIYGNLLDRINRSISKALADEYPRLKKLLDLTTELMPGRGLSEELADVIEELSEEEAQALDDSLGPARAGTPGGRVAIAQKAGSKMLTRKDDPEEQS
tara:strand:- start:72 stop:533 length:462 start_codon:yes stop_codon:yes gene_type:complete